MRSKHPAKTPPVPKPRNKLTFNIAPSTSGEEHPDHTRSPSTSSATKKPQTKPHGPNLVRATNQKTTSNKSHSPATISKKAMVSN